MEELELRVRLLEHRTGLTPTPGMAVLRQEEPGCWAYIAWRLGFLPAAIAANGGVTEDEVRIQVCSVDRQQEQCVTVREQIRQKISEKSSCLFAGSKA